MLFRVTPEFWTSPWLKTGDRHAACHGKKTYSEMMSLVKMYIQMMMFRKKQLQNQLVSTVHNVCFFETMFFTVVRGAKHHQALWVCCNHPLVCPLKTAGLPYLFLAPGRAFGRQSAAECICQCRAGFVRVSSCGPCGVLQIRLVRHITSLLAGGWLKKKTFCRCGFCLKLGVNSNPWLMSSEIWKNVPPVPFLVKPGVKVEFRGS